MIKILFWNINGNNVSQHVCDIANSTTCDIVILTESGQQPVEILKLLQSNVSGDFYYPICTENRFQLFCRKAKLNLREFYAGNRVSLRHLHYKKTTITLGIIHFFDKRNYDPSHQTSQMTLLANEIREREVLQGHNRTILIGDFNMNPFEQPMNTAECMNAMMTVRCTESGSRTVQNIPYDYFYNPMWNFFGDRTPGPSGTYYHSSSSNGIFGWNMLDQVLLRPSTTQWFNGVKILTMAGQNALHKNSGRPNESTASDHFPILLTLK